MKVIVGHWSRQKEDHGFSVVDLNPETGELTLGETLRPEHTVSEQCCDPESGIVYLCDDIIGRHEGHDSSVIMTYRLDGDSLTEIDTHHTFMAKPADICIEHTGKYALVAYYGGMGHVTRTVRDENGKIRPVTVVEEAGTALYRLNADGSVGELLDFVTTDANMPENPYAASHQHCVVEAPCGDLFLVCDKGLDRIYSIALDRESETLKLLHTTCEQPKSMPRGVVFIEGTDLLIETSEGKPEVHLYSYDGDTGILTLLEAFTLTDQEGPTVQCSALEHSPISNVIYASVRGANLICTLAVEDGHIKHLQTVSCEGDNPRGLRLTPDGRHLLVSNVDGGTMTEFGVKNDGTLEYKLSLTTGGCPSNMSIIG